jgi:hypothetical protein
VVFLRVLLHQELQRFIKRGQLARLRAGVNFVAGAVIGDNFTLFDLKRLTEAGLKQIGRDGDFIGDKFGT